MNTNNIAFHQEDKKVPFHLESDAIFLLKSCIIVVIVIFSDLKADHVIDLCRKEN